jgi:hypothetical protein
MMSVSNGDFCSSFRRLFLVCATAAALSGCVTADKPGLSLEARQSLRLTRADVDFAPGATTHISAVEDQAQAQGANTREQVAAAERAHIQRVLSSEFMAIVGPRLSAGRPVAAKIHVVQFYIPGAAAALMMGGSSAFSAGVDLVDEKSGDVLVTIPPGKIANSVYRPGGIIGFAVQAAAANDPVDAKTREISQKFSAEYAAWVVSN